MRKGVAVILAVSGLLAGCGSAVEGSAVAPVRWDPCSIPDSAISATGLDLTFEKIGWGAGIEVDDWSLCRFRAPTERQAYFLNVLSSELHTVDEARKNESNVEGADLVVSGRDAFQYETRISAAVKDCNIAVDVPPGVVVFTVDFVGGIEPTLDPCELARSHAMDLEKHLPPNPK